MKKTILILSALLVFAACVHEGEHDGCPGYVNLVFAHNGNVADFDDRIASDVRLYIYDEGELRDGNFVDIPYERIRGGKPFRIAKTTEEMKVIAWALYRVGDDSPSYGGVEGFASAVFELLPDGDRTGTPEGYSPRIPGAEPLYVEGAAVTESYRMISFSDKLCSVDIVIENAAGYAGAAGSVGYQLKGSSTGIYAGNSSSNGERAVVYGEFTPETRAAKYSTPTIGIMPASSEPGGEADKLHVTILNNGNPSMAVDTGVESVSGRHVVIVINYSDGMATIKVDDWELRTQVTFL